MLISYSTQFKMKTLAFSGEVAGSDEIGSEARRRSSSLLIGVCYINFKIVAVRRKHA
jgi:hypothetical protein